MAAPPPDRSARPAVVTDLAPSGGGRAVFISYRSADGKKDAARLAENLREIFGSDQVFYDKHDLEGGESWRAQIESALDRRPIVLLVLSEQYFGARDGEQLRISQADDPVRRELLDALRVRAQLLPLLCEGVTMPRAADLPAELRAVPEAHALKLRTEDWRSDLLRLTDRLVELGVDPADEDWREHLQAQPGPRRRWRWGRPMAAGAVAAALAAGGGGAWWWHGEQQRQRAFDLLSEGLAAHRGKDLNLDLARLRYLAALEVRPDYGAAHYFLAQVYATQGLRDAARVEYRAALAEPTGLDLPQRSDARERLAALEKSAQEPQPLGAPMAGAGPAPPPPPAVVAGATDSTAGTSRPGSGAVIRSPSIGAVVRPRPDLASPAAEGAVALVARVPATAERQREARAQAEALFSADAKVRLDAVTTLGVEPGLASDVLPLALQRALDVMRNGAMSDADRAGAIATVRLASSASPVSLQAHRATVERLLAATRDMDTTFKMQAGMVTAMQRLAASEGKRPLVYLQIGAEAQRPYAGRLAARLRDAGYTVPGIENIGARAPARTDLRAQGNSNLGLARWMVRTLGQAGAGGVELRLLRSAQPAVDTYEIWLSRSLCVAPDQQPAECRAG